MSTKKDIIHLQKGKKRKTKERKKKKVTLQYSHIIHYFDMCLPFLKESQRRTQKKTMYFIGESRFNVIKTTDFKGKI